MSRRWWGRGEMWGKAWVPGAWKVNCTVCPPLQETTVSQSVIINQREKQEGTAETEEAAKCTESAEEMEKDRQKGRGGECNTCLWLFYEMGLLVMSTSWCLQPYFRILRCLSSSVDKMLVLLEVMPNTCLCQQHIQTYSIYNECLLTWLCFCITTGLSLYLYKFSRPKLAPHYAKTATCIHKAYLKSLCNPVYLFIPCPIN